MRGWRGYWQSMATLLFHLCGANPPAGMAGPLWPTAPSDRREESKVREAPRTTYRTCSPWCASRGSTSGRTRGVGQDSSSISLHLRSGGFRGYSSQPPIKSFLESLKTSCAIGARLAAASVEDVEARLISAGIRKTRSSASWQLCSDYERADRARSFARAALGAAQSRYALVEFSLRIARVGQNRWFTNCRLAPWGSRSHGRLGRPELADGGPAALGGRNVEEDIC